jgi:nucleoside-diphosphate-sugar epimerase
LVIVTGGLGFIGSHVAERLVERGEEVIIVDKKKEDEALIRELRQIPAFEEARIVYGDLRDKSFVEELINKYEPTTIYHLAALASHRLSIEDPYTYIEQNTTTLLNVLEAARKSRVKPRIVFSSSSSIYGNTPPPLREEMEPRPSGPYALSKYFGEQICRLYHELYDVECIVLRYFNVIGERCRGNIVLKIFVDNILEGKPLVVNGRWIDGKFYPATRDFTYVGDIADGTILAGQLKSSFEVINLGAGRPTSVLELAERVIEEMGRERSRIEYASLSPHEALHSYSDNSKARRLLNWEPRVDLRTIVKRYVEWRLKNH